ncbi:MAG: ATP-dependent DNA helicase RecG, partial [Cellulomonadaceae bacterium]|nr:ATP-dependent DNA helicase RecG [Cellulomonadaceae bacterium]
MAGSAPKGTLKGAGAAAVEATRSRALKAVAPLGGHHRLAEPLQTALGTKTANALATLGLNTVGDLLGHYPRRYVEPGRQTTIEKLTAGEYVSVFGTVLHSEIRQNSNGGYRLEVLITDGTSELQLTFFARKLYAVEWRLKNLSEGVLGVFSGTVNVYNGKLQLTHPAYALVGEKNGDESEVRLNATKPIPIYPANAKTPTWVIQNAIKPVLDTLAKDDIPDPLRGAIVSKYTGGLPKLAALRHLHAPATEAEWRAAQKRFQFEEAFLLQVALGLRRLEAQASPTAPRPLAAGSKSLLGEFDGNLPFTLTSGQMEIGKVISEELGSTVPMQRLLVGEVGSGKTVVALRAMLQVIDAGGQCVLLAPTEVLATQHAQSLTKMLGGLANSDLLAQPQVKVSLLTGSTPSPQRKDILLDIISGHTKILVGTHALLEDKVQFADLGLVVVDEQHRFGVEQREKLKSKGTAPNLLVMTATPIPRTIAMTVFGDLDISQLKELPPGRQPITTHVVPEYKTHWLHRTWQRVAEEVKKGHQVFVVCPRIGDSVANTTEKGRELHTVAEVLEHLQNEPALAGITMEALHGQMKSADKEAVMQRFRSAATQLLVSTTVIEVGVDIPAATVMVIFDADLFGVSQLHQLRG